VVPGTTGEAGWGDIKLRAAAIPGTTGEAGWGDIVMRRRRNEEGGVRLVVVLPVVIPMGRRRSKWNAKGARGSGGVRLAVAFPVVMTMGRRRSKWNADDAHAVGRRLVWTAKGIRVVDLPWNVS